MTYEEFAGDDDVFLPKLRVTKIHPDAIIPKYQTSGSSGFDFHCVDDFVIYPFETKLIKTGLCFDIPHGYELQIRSRSGLALKHSIVVLNSPATIDSDYTGEVAIILCNFGVREIAFKNGDRIAQGVLCMVDYLPIEEVNSITKTTERGSGGFGSTGI